MSDQKVMDREPISPQMMLEHFVATFYETFKGEKPAGHFTHLRNEAVEGAWSRGHLQGLEDGYNKALYDMELANHKGEQFIKKLRG